MQQCFSWRVLWTKLEIVWLLGFVNVYAEDLIKTGPITSAHTFILPVPLMNKMPPTKPNSNKILVTGMAPYKL